MKRYFAHYIFIFPNELLKNHIVELDKENRITNTYPFTVEVANTEFVSGLIIFQPINFADCNINEKDLIKLYPQLETYIVTSNYLIRGFSV